MTDEEIEALAVQHEAFGFGAAGGKSPSTHGFDPQGLLAFARAIQAAERVRICQILAGIDKAETEDAAGWWETSAGAEFGAKKLAAILDGFNLAMERDKQETYIDQLEGLHDAVRRYFRFKGVDDVLCHGAEMWMLERMHKITAMQQSGELDTHNSRLTNSPISECESKPN